MTKKVNKTTKLQKLFLIGAILAGIAGLFISHAKAADLLYAPKTPHVAQVYDGWYLAGRGSINFPDDFSGISFDNGFGASAAVGYDFGQFGLGGLRIEAETGYLTQDAQLPAPFTGSVDALYGFLNAYVDFDTGFGLNPFFGGGVGMANVDASVSNGGGFNLQATDSQFAWNLTGGLSYDLTNNITLDVAYRFLSVPDVTFSTPFGSTTDDVNSHQVTGGLRLKL